MSSSLTRDPARSVADTREATASRTATGRLAAAAARVAQRRPKTIIAAWLLLVVACVFLGASVGTRSLTSVQSEVGQSARADALLQHEQLLNPASESVLITAATPRAAAAAAADLSARAAALPQVASVTGPEQSPELLGDGGRAVLVQVQLRGDPDMAQEHVGELLDLDAQVERSHAGIAVREAGDGTQSKAINDLISKDLSRAELIALPITLVILVLAFGALVAACVPLILGITAVAGAIGALGLVSHMAPNSQSTSAFVVLIGLAVGVDYSLFYVRREREERRRGHGPARREGRATTDSALEAAASSVGRAILIAGLTVVTALAGLLLTGAGDFVSIGLGTIVVVAIAVVGSLTVLPAVLAWLGDRVDRGRIPGHRRRGAARELCRLRAGRPTGSWAALARGVTRRPRVALLSSVLVLGALAIPMVGMHTGDPQASDLPQDLPVAQAAKAIEQTFPGAPQDAELVVTGHDLATPTARISLSKLGNRALAVTGGRGDVTVAISADGSLARVDVPMPDLGRTASKAVVDRLRGDVADSATAIAGVSSAALVTGDAASSVDYSRRMSEVTPLVIGFVLLLGFVLLMLAFRAPLLAASMMLLNLLSVGAAYGILTAVFQHTWAEHLLGFRSTGWIINWLPLFMFVVLFGLSMDYTVLILERIREERLRGLAPRAAAAQGVAATAGTVTSAAVVMVAVFSIFATLGVITFKQLGVGLAAAVLLDATLVRGVALPAVVALLGKRGWRIRGCEDAEVTAGAEQVAA